MTRKEIENSFHYKASKEAVAYSQQFAHDDNLQGEVVEAFEKGADCGRDLTVEKAAEWLNQWFTKSTIQDFKKYMKEI